MAKTYKAVEVASAGSLRIVKRPIRAIVTVRSLIRGATSLAFSVPEKVRPMIERLLSKKAGEAYARMMRGEARFRIVLTTGQ